MPYYSTYPPLPPPKPKREEAGWGTGGNNPPHGGSGITKMPNVMSAISDPAPRREIVIHYNVALPNGECVTLADKDSADRLCRFLNERFKAATPSVPAT